MNNKGLGLIGSRAYKLEQLRKNFEIACEPLRAFVDTKIETAKEFISRNSKNIKKNMTKVGAAVLLTTILLTSCAAKPDENAEFWEVEQPAYEDTVTSTLGVDRGLMYQPSECKAFLIRGEHYGFYSLDSENSIVRLWPNEEGKIYVGINKNVRDEGVEKIKESLEYITEVFKPINPLYNFVVVDAKEFRRYKAQGKTVIEYSEVESIPDMYDEETDTRGTVVADANSRAYSSGKWSYISRVKIRINAEAFYQQSENKQLADINHELMHALGFDDIYKQHSLKYSDSIMNPYMGLWTSKITPRDLATLYDAYCFDFIDENNEINYNKLNEVKQIIKEYEEEFYKEFVSNFKKYAEDLDNIRFESFDDQILNGVSMRVNNGELVFYFSDNGEYTYSLQEEDHQIDHPGKMIAEDGCYVIPNIKDSKSTYFMLLTKNGENLDVIDLHFENNFACLVGSWEDFFSSHEAGVEPPLEP